MAFGWTVIEGDPEGIMAAPEVDAGDVCRDEATGDAQIFASTEQVFGIIEFECDS